MGVGVGVEDKTASGIKGQATGTGTTPPATGIAGAWGREAQPSLGFNPSRGALAGEADPGLTGQAGYGPERGRGARPRG